MIVRVEQMMIGRGPSIERGRASTVGISMGSVRIILHEDLKIGKFFKRIVPRVLIEERSDSRVRILIHDDVMEGSCIPSVVTIDESWIPFFTSETKRQSAQWKHSDSHH